MNYAPATPSMDEWGHAYFRPAIPISPSPYLETALDSLSATPTLRGGHAHIDLLGLLNSSGIADSRDTFADFTLLPSSGPINNKNKTDFNNLQLSNVPSSHAHSLLDVSVSTDLANCLGSLNEHNQQWEQLMRNQQQDGAVTWKQIDDDLLNEGNSIPDVTDLIFGQSVEELHCFKCKFCPSIYISLSREEALAHLIAVHDKEFFEMEKNILGGGVPPAQLPPWNTVGLQMAAPTSQTVQPPIELAMIEQTEKIPKNQETSQNELPQQPLLKEQPGQQDGNFVCGKCHWSFPTLLECQQHMSKAHNVKSSRIRVEKPVTMVTNNTECLKSKKKCATVAKKEISVAKKRKTITPLQKLTRERLNAHQDYYICEFKGCNVRFKCLDNLGYHCKCHVLDASGNGLVTFACPVCAYRSERWSAMAGHLWRHHVVDLELQACDQCSFKTFSLSKLENLHKRIHKEERAYACDYCDKSFKTSKQLWGHKVIHLDESAPLYQVIECTVCNRRFSDKRLLRFHLDTVHYKQRPYLCHCCGYSASCRSTLRMHLRQHTGEKPFHCDSCNYRTADHNSLRRHKMIHSGEKPYKCPYCAYACIQSSTYKAHLKSKHPGQNGDLIFGCSQCPFKTINQDTFQTHVADHKLDAVAKETTTSSSNSCHDNQELIDGANTLTLVEAVQFSLQEHRNK